MLTDDAGGESDRYGYRAFGEVLDKDGATDNSYLYAGEQFDNGLNLYYMRARFMNNGFARFLSSDKFTGLQVRPFSLNKFLYGESDSVNNIDPSGFISLQSLSVAMTNIGRSTARAGKLFAKGQARAAGKLMNSIGRSTEKKVKQIVEECIKPKKLKSKPRIDGSRRQLDLLAEAEDVVLNIEVKNKIPSYGSAALRRLRDQLLDAQKAGSKVTLVGGNKISNNTLEKSLGYLERAGVNLGGVDVFNGMISFAKWSAEVYYEECLED